MDIEQKLALIQQIHREQAENERYIYDNLRQRDNNKGINYFGEYSGGYGKDVYRRQSQGTWFGSFRFRLLVAALLFICFFVMDKNNVAYKDIGSQEIVEYIGSNFRMKDWNHNLVKFQWE